MSPSRGRGAAATLPRPVPAPSGPAEASGRSAGRPAAGSAGRRLGRRSLASLAAVAAVVGALLLVPGSPLRIAGSTPPAPAGFAVPPAYHVVYEDTAPGVAPSTERLWVSRPFGSVDEMLGGAPPGGSLYLRTVTRLGREVLQSGSGQPALLQVPVVPAPPDVRLDAVLGVALAEGRLVAEGADTVAGRRCRVLRSAASLRGGPLQVLRSGRDYVDTCVDSSGLVLDERTTRGGRLVSERRAVSVVVGVAPGGDFGAGGVATPLQQGGGSTRALTLSSRPPGRSWDLPRAPSGFRHAGRYAVIPPQPQAFAQPGAAAPGQGGLPGSLVVAMDDLYVSGADVIVIEQGETLNGARFVPPAGGRSVDLGRLGTGQLVLSAGASSVTAEPPGESGFVRVTGTVPPGVLLSLARSLVSVGGGTLVTIPGGGQ